MCSLFAFVDFQPWDLTVQLSIKLFFCFKNSFLIIFKDRLVSVILTMFNCIWHNDVLQKQNFIWKKRNFHFIFLHKTKKMKKYKKKIMTMYNFMWLDIDSSWQTSDSKWLDRFCDSTLTRLDQVMTRLWLDSKGLWLDSWLDKYDSSTSLVLGGSCPRWQLSGWKLS